MRSAMAVMAATTSAQAPSLFRWKRLRYTDRRLRIVSGIGMLVAWLKLRP